MKLADFHNLHRGQTCVIAGVGPNLTATPPHWFDYPCFGVNTIYKQAIWPGWKPTYFVGVDERLRLEDGEAICEVYRDVPKFFPSPDWDALQGENIYRFKHFEGIDLLPGGFSPKQADALTRHGITYRRVMDAVFQIAMNMGFTTILMIGVQHKPNNGNDEDRAHFWGVDTKAVPDQPFDWWFDGYRTFTNLPGASVLNISHDTYVPETIIPRGDWRAWASPAAVLA